MTKQDIFEKSIEILQHNGFMAELASKNYLKSCYENKEILDVANKLGEIKIEIAKNESIQLQNQREQLKIQMIALLKKNKKDISKIFPKYNCKICEDTGFLKNGQICSCLQEEYIKNLLNYTGINLDNQPKLNEVNVEKNSNPKDIKNLISILSKIETTKYNTILFSGETGTGKTFIAKSFLKSFVSKNNLAKFYSAPSINNIFLNIHKDFKLAKSLDELMEPDLIVIDDFGSESIFNNITREYFLILLSERQKENKLTLFTTNLTLNDIKTRYNERFLSRIIDKNVSLKYNFTGKDLRLS